MTVEFLLVSFSEDRDVMANGDRVGVTNHTILLPADEYDITLSGTGYAPEQQTIVLAATSIMRPKVVPFSAAAAGRAAASDAARGVPGQAGLPQPAARSRQRQRSTA